MMMKTEELEEFRRRMNARIAELEDAAEQARMRAIKLDKEKNRLTIEIREITVELDAVSCFCLSIQYSQGHTRLGQKSIMVLEKIGLL